MLRDPTTRVPFAFEGLPDPWREGQASAPYRAGLGSERGADVVGGLAAVTTLLQFFSSAVFLSSANSPRTVLRSVE